MRGDFSSVWNKEDKRNFNGVLHQQGRVLLDRDWNAQTEIFNDWQETAAQDIIGAGVAAVPSDAVESFKITKAKILNPPDRIKVSVNEGRVWADGLLIELNANVVREATYLESPIQNQPGDIDDLPNNIRDAVILEAWHEELNAFQMPDLLIEPALGGVDTTERFQTAFRFRLFRMDANDTCDSIINSLKDNFDNKGKLKAVLQPDVPVNGDCPVVQGGGYTGFEHQLYRIEIAQTDKPKMWFKWSQFNGGLVGRGTFDSNGGKVKIDANLNAILHSGLTNFYLETLEEKNGYWQVTFGAKVTLDTGDNTLTLPSSAANVFFSSAAAMDGKKVFFRLWNGIEKVGDFTTAEKDLQDGIRLQFEAEVDGKYTAHDFWIFSVRTDEVFDLSPFLDNPKILIDNQSPQGIFYHRVPLAELNWTSDEITGKSGDIEDCRQIFQPLTKLKTCCTYRVGNGVNSHGDFTTIQAAINALPKAGGEICILPGVYKENVVLEAPHNQNIEIKGCGYRTRIVAKSDKPVIRVDGGVNLKIESLSVTAHKEGVGILLEGDEIVADDEDRKEIFGVLRDIELKNLRIAAAARSAIEMHVGQFVSIRGCQIFIKDADTEWQAAVYLAGDDLLFEENEIRVMTEREAKTEFGKTDDPRVFRPAKRATGGLHLSGGCERVRVINNIIIGGIGNGITLGSVDVETTETVIRHIRWQKKGRRGEEDCEHNPGVIIITEIDEDTRLVAGAPLRDILIERNRIFSMGLNGVGVDGFFPVEESNPNDRLRRKRKIEFITVENLVVIGNRIEFCLNRLSTDFRATKFVGYGGVALALVENTIVRDNFITDNGANYLEPTCGIFILHGSGIEISRNHILNNGRRDDKPRDEKVKDGARGGIFIFLAGEGTMNVGGKFSSSDLASHSGLIKNGIPALKLHENIVAVPMGRALTMKSTGNVSITDNQFLSQSIAPGGNKIDFLAASVLIFSLNTASHSAPSGYAKARDGQLKAKAYYSDNQTLNGTPSENLSGYGKRFLSGAIHFADNQCELINRAGRGKLSALSAILILTLDDVGFLGNQTNCSLNETRMLTDTLLFGVNVRASDNSWRETPGSVSFSAVTLGAMLNTTTDNHSTHCLLIRGKLFLSKYNLTLFDLVSGLTGDVRNIDESDKKTPCEEKSKNILGNFGKSRQVIADNFETNPNLQNIDG